MAVVPMLIVTRPREQALPWVERLRARGVGAAAVPLLDIQPCAQSEPLEQAWRELHTCSVVVFVSPNAATHFFSTSPTGGARTWPDSTWAAAPGQGTARALIALGVPAQRILQPPPDAEQFDSESLWPVMAPLPWAGRRALVVRGDGGREWLSDRLREAGATVDHLSVYRRAAPVLLAEERAVAQAAWLHPERFVWLFSSSEALGHLPAVMSGIAAGSSAPFAHWAAQSPALATHPRIMEQAQRLGFTRVAASRPDLHDVIAGLAAYNPAHRES